MKVFKFYFLQEKKKNPHLHEKIKIDEVWIVFSMKKQMMYVSFHIYAILNIGKKIILKNNYIKL
jgi:hypothetical protein